MVEKYEIDLEKFKGLSANFKLKPLDSERFNYTWISQGPELDDHSLRRILYSFDDRGGNISDWETSLTDPHSHGKNFRYLVHAVHDGYSVSRLMQKQMLCELAVERKIDFRANKIDLLQDPERIAEKPIISTSLIDENHRSTWAPGGYILTVPVDNILRTASRDIGTLFFGGLDEVKKLYAERDLREIDNPDSVLAYTSGICSSGYNEIVLTGTGRTGKKVQIQGVFAKMLPDGQYINDDLGSTLSWMAASRHLPFLKIQEPFIPYKDKDPDVSEKGDWFAVHDNDVRYVLLPEKEKFWALKYGGLKEQAMTPEQRQFAIGKAKLFLQSSPNETLHTLIEKAEAVPDEVLWKRVRLKQRYQRSKHLLENILREFENLYPDLNTIR